MMGLSLVTGPADEPLTIEEVQEAASIDDDLITSPSEQAYINGLIKSARFAAEAATRRVFITQEWEITLERFPGRYITIPLPPLQSITSIKYVDNNGVQQTLDSSVYIVDTSSEPGVITPAYDEVWPTPRFQLNSVIIRFVAGYGTAADVPEGIKLWMKFMIKTAYDQRERFVIGSRISEVNTEYIDGLLDPYRVLTF